MPFFHTSRDRIIAASLLAVAILALTALRPIIARYNDAYLLHTLIASGRLQTFMINSSAGPFFIQTASSNGYIVTKSWTAIVFHDENGYWLKMEKFDHHRTYYLAYGNGVANYPDIAEQLCN